MLAPEAARYLCGLQNPRRGLEQRVASIKPKGYRRQRTEQQSVSEFRPLFDIGLDPGFARELHHQRRHVKFSTPWPEPAAIPAAMTFAGGNGLAPLHA